MTPAVGPVPAGGPGGRGTGRRRRRSEALMVPPADFVSYYGRPIVKASPWEADIPLYLFLGGLAGGSSLLAAGADLTGRPALRRSSRLTAVGAVTVSFAALVHDLGKPSRFHHMLRVLKVTSPMSVGTWILTAYGPMAGLAALSEGRSLLRPGPRRLGRIAAGLGPTAGAAGLVGAGSGRLGRVAAGLGPAGRAAGLMGARSGRGRIAAGLGPAGRAAGLVAAGLGPALAAYTAVLLADTATPSWHDAREQLPFVFVGSAAAAAGGMGLLAVPQRDSGPARSLAVGGALAELAMTRRMESEMGLSAEPMHQGRAGRYLRAAKVLTASGALLAVAAGRRRAGSAAAGVCLLAGSFCTRFGIFHAGQQSARDPRYTVVPQRERLDAGKPVRSKA